MSSVTLYVDATTLNRIHLPFKGVTSFQGLTSAQLAALGVKEVSADRPDDQYYYVAEQDAAPYFVGTLKPLDQIRPLQVSRIGGACEAAIYGGFQAQLGAVTKGICYSAQDQGNLDKAATVVLAKTATPKTWAANTNFAQFDVILDAGEFYIATAGGKSGAVKPTWPTAFQTPVADGTVQWARFGMLVATYTDTTVGGVTTRSYANEWFNAADVSSIYGQSVNYLTDCRARYTLLRGQINAATTLAAILAVVW